METESKGQCKHVLRAATELPLDKEPFLHSWRCAGQGGHLDQAEFIQADGYGSERRGRLHAPARPRRLDSVKLI